MTNTATIRTKQFNRVGFGAMQLAGPGVFGPPADHDVAVAVLRRAVELGVDHIDTAQFYGPDVVNDLIREALHPYPDGLKLATKVGARRDDKGNWNPAQHPAELREDVETNLRTLGVERLDLVNLRLHDDSGRSTEATSEQLGLMEDLRREGKLDLVGISNVSTDGLRAALDLVEVDGVQNAYSIKDRRDEATLALCRERGIAYVPYFPLGSAFTGGPQLLAEDPVLQNVASKHGATPAQVALAWLLALDEHVLLIPGTGSIGHLEENMGAGAITLDHEDLGALAAVEQTEIFL